MSLGLANEKSAFVQVMAWCRQTTSHYLSQCWPSSMPPNGCYHLVFITLGQWFTCMWWQSPFHSQYPIVNQMTRYWHFNITNEIVSLYNEYWKLNYVKCDTNPYVPNYFEETSSIDVHFFSIISRHWDGTGSYKSFLMEDNDPVIQMAWQ